MSDWRNVLLEDVTDEVTVGHVGPMASEYTPHGIPFLRSQDIEPYRINLSEITHISEDFHQRLQKSALKPGDVVIVRTGKPGTAAVVPDSLKVANCSDLVIVRPSRELDSRFLAYYINTLGNRHVAAHLVGAVQQHFNVGSARKLRLLLPRIEEQRDIADVLGALDDKIELNRRMNETLEAIARAIFKSWFVDFNPVRAKAAGRQPAGISHDIARLFPTKLVKSAAGPIPDGWRCAPLPQAIEINPPRDLERSCVAPYLDMANVPQNSPRPLNWRNREFTSGSRFGNGDTLLARITPCLENGKTAYVDFLARDQVGWGSTEFIVLHPKAPLPPEYGYFLARCEEFRAFAIGNMTGTSGRQRVPTDCFAAYMMVVPPPEIAGRFGEITAGLMHRIKRNDEESSTLAELRDTLLPKLLSGEVRVNELSVGATI